MMLYKLNNRLLSIALISALFFNIAHAGQLASRLQSVDKLLTTSSAAQKIKGSGNQAAKQKQINRTETAMKPDAQKDQYGSGLTNE